MTCADATTDELADLVRDTRQAASAYINGKVREYLALVRPVENHTLLPPSGGKPVYGRLNSDEAIEVTSRYFEWGEAELEVVQSYASGDLAVLGVIEHQHGRVGGLPDQDLSLRVTLVYCRDGSGWRQVYRHADPLVQSISLEQLAMLLRGEQGQDQADGAPSQ